MKRTVLRVTFSHTDDVDEWMLMSRLKAHLAEPFVVRTFIEGDGRPNGPRAVTKYLAACDDAVMVNTDQQVDSDEGPLA